MSAFLDTDPLFKALAPLSDAEQRVVSLLREENPIMCRSTWTIMTALNVTQTWRATSARTPPDVKLLLRTRHFTPPRVYSAFRRLAGSKLRPVRFDREKCRWIVDEDALVRYVFSRGKRSKNYGFPIEHDDGGYY